MLWEWRLQGPGRPHGLRCAAGGDSASRGQGRSAGLGDDTKSGRGRSRVSDAPGPGQSQPVRPAGGAGPGLSAPLALVPATYAVVGPRAPGPSGNLDSLSRASTFSLRVMDLERESLDRSPEEEFTCRDGRPRASEGPGVAGGTSLAAGERRTPPVAGPHEPGGARPARRLRACAPGPWSSGRGAALPRAAPSSLASVLTIRMVLE